MLNFGRNGANGPYDSIGQQGFPGQLPYGQYNQGYSPGTIRNTLGSGLKANGFFQKDGQIKNSRGKFIGGRQPGIQGVPYQTALPVPGSGGFMPQQQQNGYEQEYMYDQGGYQPDMGFSQNQGYYQSSGRQFVLEAAQEGIMGNGVATISADNSFVLIANLPSPQMFLASGQKGVYASYLVDDKGRSGFLAGVLRSVGNGVYRVHFQSPVPLHHYSRAIVSIESPGHLGPAPNGPIILKVKEPLGMMTFLNPMKNTAVTIWGKIIGFISSRTSKAAPSPGNVPVQEAVPVNPELMQPLNQIGVDPGAMQPPAAFPPRPGN